MIKLWVGLCPTMLLLKKKNLIENSKYSEIEEII